MANKLLSTGEVAARLGVSRKVIQRLALEGKISCYKLDGDFRKKKRGSKMFFKLSEVKLFFKQHHELSVYELLTSLHRKVDSIEKHLRGSRCTG
jgi:excisionase family DNA binding protein